MNSRSRMIYSIMTKASFVMLIILICHPNSSLGDIYGTCGRDVTCFGMPESSCNLQTGSNCDMLFKAAVESKTDRIEMELTALVDDNNRWWAVGFSDDQSMGDDAVFDCVQLRDNSIQLRRSNNVRKKNEDSNDSNGISRIRTGLSNNHVTCKWIHEPVLHSRSKSFDLLNSGFHILLAKGPLKGSSGSIKGYHSGQKTSSERLSLKPNVSSGSTSSSVFNLVRIHGGLMVIVWLPVVSIAILMARHFKTSFGDSTCCGLKFWFFIHRTLMTLAIVGVIGSIYSIYVHVGGISDLYSNHQILGMIAITAMIFQVFTAMVRCHPESSKRWLYNWTHFFGGNLAHISALAALFTAPDISSSLPSSFIYVLISFITVHVLVHLVLQCYSYQHDNYDDSKVHDINHLSMGDPYVSDPRILGSRNVFELESSRMAMASGRPRRKNGLRYTLLALYVLAVTTTASVLIFILFKHVK